MSGHFLGEITWKHVLEMLWEICYFFMVPCFETEILAWHLSIQLINVGDERVSMNKSKIPINPLVNPLLASDWILSETSMMPHKGVICIKVFRFGWTMIHLLQQLTLWCICRIQHWQCVEKMRHCLPSSGWITEPWLLQDVAKKSKDCRLWSKDTTTTIGCTRCWEIVEALSF